MFSLVLLAILEGFKKLWIETEEYVTGRMIVAAHVLLYLVFFTFWLYSFEPDTEFSRAAEEEYSEGIVIRPREVQKERDHERHKKERVENIENFIFSESGIALLFSLVTSVANSVMLYRRRNQDKKSRYKEVGIVLFRLFAASPLIISASAVFLLLVSVSDVNYRTDPFSSGYFGIVVFFFYVFLVSALYRLYRLELYGIKTGKMLLWFLASCAASAFGFFILYVVAMSHVKFGG